MTNLDRSSSCISWPQIRLFIDSRGLTDLQRYRLAANLHDEREYQRLLSEFGKVTTITISKFYRGQHYHLASNQPDLHFTEKYGSYEDAEKEALKHTTRRHISFRDATHFYGAGD